MLCRDRSFAASGTGSVQARPTGELIRGEELNVLIGSRPFCDDEGQRACKKLNILDILYKKYGVTEEDFLSAELECVPAGKPRDIGFDRSMIGSYGHDDRVCAYPCLMAALDSVSPKYTTVAILADKEETGSDGNTGMNSAFLRHFIGYLADMQGGCAALALEKSKCLSADVNAAFDPTFPDVMEKAQRMHAELRRGYHKVYRRARQGRHIRCVG